MNVSAILVEVGVNMGDHGQDVYSAQEILPGETVEAFANRLLKPRYPGNGQHYTYRIELRIIQPAKES